MSENLKKGGQNMKESQTVIPGILTEADIVSDYMRRIGRKGGSKRTPCKVESSRQLMNKINERKRLSSKARKDGSHA